MKSEHNVNMIQEASCRWRIETDDGILISQDIMIGRIAEAEEYIRQFITSFSNWTYKIKPLEDTCQQLVKK